MNPANDEAVALCRPGFENECAAELLSALRPFAPGAFARARPDSARVEIACHGEDIRECLLAAFSIAKPVFVRQIAGPVIRIDGLRPGTRAGDIVERLTGCAPRYRDLFIEHCDSEDGRALARLTSRLDGPLRQILCDSKLLDPDAADAPRLHVLMLDGASCLAGPSLPGLSSDWPLGIPRLRLRGGAPSRSARKLEEAFHRFLGEADAVELHRGMVAADLGSSPGGWSAVLAGRGLQVIAVDNGPMRLDASAAHAVEHHREDAFRYCPPRKVDWMTCDVAAAPGRVSALVARWIEQDWCARSVFNLKLPMKRRLDELTRCREAIEDAAAPGDRVEFAHLYHDRLEVTGFFRRGR